MKPPPRLSDLPPDEMRAAVIQRFKDRNEEYRRKRLEPRPSLLARALRLLGVRHG